jgi:hypothetical protein
MEAAYAREGGSDEATRGLGVPRMRGRGMGDQSAVARALDVVGRSVGREEQPSAARERGGPPLGFSVRERPRVRARVCRPPL